MCGMLADPDCKRSDVSDRYDLVAAWKRGKFLENVQRLVHMRADTWRDLTMVLAKFVDKVAQCIDTVGLLLRFFPLKFNSESERLDSGPN